MTAPIRIKISLEDSLNRIKNAKSLPKVFYGLHMSEGVAEYADQGTEPYRILICENALKVMDTTYAGKPVYVQHVDEVDLTTLQEDADGYVMESFFNTNDGKHWVRFIVVSDKGHEAIRRGWQLSNSYVPQAFSNGGQWHGVEYAKEITRGEYEHLAIVPNPRYEESVILTPEEFKRYNNEKKIELESLSNSKEEEIKNMALKWFKKAKVENSADLTDMSVVLPKSGKEVTIEKLVADADEIAARKENSLADPSDKVKMHDGNMCNVAELLKKHKALHDELEGMKEKKENTEEKEEDVKAKDEDVEVEGDDKAVDNDDEDADDESTDNEEEKSVAKAEEDEEEVEAAKKKKNDLEVASEKKAAAKAKADRLKNAHLNFEPDEVAVVELMQDQVARGKSRYGSN